MGRGKKKDKKKEEVPSVASLSLSDTPQPSTSQQQQSDDEGLGLTGGGHKKKKKDLENEPVKMEVTEAVAESTKVQQEATKSQEVVMKPLEDPDAQKRKEIKDDDEECEGLGLGLGGGKKNRRKKKKSDNAAPAAPAGPAALAAPAAPVVSAASVPQAVSETRGQMPKLVPMAPDAQPKPTGPPSSWGKSIQQTSFYKPSPTPPVLHAQIREATPLVQQAVYMGSQPGTSAANIPGRSRGRGQSRQGPPGQSKDGVGMHTAAPLAPMCLFKIPEKVLGRSVPCRQVKILANYLEMKIQPLKIHRYDVTFRPEKPRKFIPVAYALAVKKYFPKACMAFDQRKNVYSLNPLPGVPLNERMKCEVVVVDANEKSVPVEVLFKFTGIVDLDTILTYMKTGGTTLNPPTEAIQAVDVILRQGTLESYIKAGRQFFKRPAKPIDLGDGLEMWTGLFQSAIFTSRPFVNIDVAHKGFPRHQLLIDAYTRDFRLDTTKTIAEQRGRNVEAFQQYLKGLKVVAYIGGDMKKGLQREFICNELVDVPRKMFFKMNEGTPKEINCNVMDYFQKEKNCRIRYPNMNCLWVGPKDRRIYYPMEFLQVSYGQVCNKQLNDMQLSTLVKESATPPIDRKRKIEEVIADMNYTKSEYFKKFGLEISSQFVNVDAKILQAPRIEVGGTSVEPRRGAWTAKRLLKPQALDSWGLISVDTDPRNSFDNVINMIIGIGNDMGMHVKSPTMVTINIRINELMRTMQMVKDKGVVFLFVIISTRGKDYYHRLKRIAEREVGVLTQCIKEMTATRKMNEQTIRNIMLKVNSKLMGINHALDSRSTPVCLQQGKIMLVGADVTHPSPDQSSVPSIAAVTASIDTKFTIYNITLSVQTPKKEMIVDFEDMMVEHLNEFEKRQRDLPSKIYVFRDGVSEGQFAQVMNSELQAVHNAYKRKVGPMSNKRPEVLFLLVQKRHHTRFFIANSPNNVEPGTVVDSYIVHPKELDFYLVSHQAIKGTARPTRYHAVCNDGRIAQDEVEQLTFYLCHLYARCTRSVSYPTPTYYAHLACMRARSLTFGDRFSNADLERAPQRLRVLERILETSKMFFV